MPEEEKPECRGKKFEQSVPFPGNPKVSFSVIFTLANVGLLFFLLFSNYGHVGLLKDPGSPIKALFKYTTLMGTLVQIELRMQVILKMRVDGFLDNVSR